MLFGAGGAVGLLLAGAVDQLFHSRALVQGGVDELEHFFRVGVVGVDEIALRLLATAGGAIAERA